MLDFYTVGYAEAVRKAYGPVLRGVIVRRSDRTAYEETDTCMKHPEDLIPTYYRRTRACLAHGVSVKRTSPTVPHLWGRASCARHRSLPSESLLATQVLFHPP